MNEVVLEDELPQLLVGLEDGQTLINEAIEEYVLEVQLVHHFGEVLCGKDDLKRCTVDE